MERTLVYSREYLEFEENSSPRVKEKLRYATAILETIYPIPTKFVKKLTNTDFYELRISVEQEVRVILFAVDNPNINLSQRVIFLNGFIKKANKDYVKEVEKAMEILRRLL
ncbi:MAG: type II toxin-antitoxin system RelE/ParE family toxin [Bacteroidales bacterium]|nr:type II toxin-antitoxin system RelE/ParE family toxin [Bacteroidales bacterium]